MPILSLISVMLSALMLAVSSCTVSHGVISAVGNGVHSVSGVAERGNTVEDAEMVLAGLYVIVIDHSGGDRGDVVTVEEAVENNWLTGKASASLNFRCRDGWE